MNTVEQDFPFYFQAHFEVSRMSSADEVLTQILQRGKLQYTLNEVPFEIFKDHYKVEVVKNINVAPFIINFFSGLVQLALGILSRSDLKIYTGARELQEGWGRLLSIGNREKGAYYVQRSLFHKEAYQFFSKKFNPDVHPYELRRLESQKFNLSDLRNNPDTIIKQFDLEKTFATVDKKIFLDKLDNFEEEFLSKISIADFIQSAATINSCFLISDKEFANLELPQLLALSQINLLVTRYKHFKKPEDVPVEKGTLMEIVSSEEIDSLLAELPPNLCWLFSDDQLLKADFSKIDNNKLSWILVWSRPKIRELVAKVPKEKLGPEFYRTCSEALKYLSDDQIKELTELNVRVLRQIFPIDGIYIPYNFDEFKRRFALIPAQKLQPCLPFMDQNVASYMSLDQLKQLDLSVIDRHQFSCIFRSPNESLKGLSGSQIESIAKHLEHKHSLHISNDVIRQINFGKLDMEETLNILCRLDEEKMQERLALLEPEQLLYVLRHLSIGFVKLISDDQIKKLPFDQMDSFDLGKIFDTRFGEEEVARRFNLVPDKVQAMLPKLGVNLAFIPDNILVDLNLGVLDSVGLRILIDNRSHLLKDSQWESCLALLNEVSIRVIPEHILLNNLDRLTDAQLAFIHVFRKETFDKIADDKKKSILGKLHT